MCSSDLGEADDCSTGDCDGGGGFGNYVKLQHADGKYTYYGHMKTWSVLVAVGDTVACGQKLGEMGSSGHSTGPHVHFEVRDSAGSSGDPFYGACSGAPSWWVDQGEWSGLPALVCDDVEPCASLGDLACGTSISTSNDTSGSTTTHGVYGCGEYTYSGPEVAYTFATDRDEAVTLSLTGNSADVDLFVLSADTCDGSGALGCSISPDADAESITFTAAAGVRYTVVADGYEGATTGFMLSAACAGAWPATSDTGTSSEDSAGLDTPVPSGGKTVEPDWVRLDDVGCGGSAAWFPFVLMGGARRVRRGRTTPSAPRRGGRGA